MLTTLLGLLPALSGLAHVVPVVLGGGGLVSVLLGLVPEWRTYVMIGLAVVALVAAGYGGIEQIKYEREKAGRAADNAAADQAALVQIDRDKRDRAAIDAQHRADMIDLQLKAATRDGAIRNAPASTGPLPPAYRAYYNSVRREQSGAAGGGQAGSR
jgi:hypothetical protein